MSSNAKKVTPPLNSRTTLGYLLFVAGGFLVLVGVVLPWLRVTEIDYSTIEENGLDLRVGVGIEMFMFMGNMVILIGMHLSYRKSWQAWLTFLAGLCLAIVPISYAWNIFTQSYKQAGQLSSTLDIGLYLAIIGWLVLTFSCAWIARSAKTPKSKALQNSYV